MKRIICWLLTISMVLTLVPVLPTRAAADTSSDPNYDRIVNISWGENGEHTWWSWHDHESGQRHTDGDPELPAGVRFEEGVLTLTDADLYSVEVLHWGTIPFRIEVLGDSRITCGDRFGLNLDSCHDMTITGGGKLTIRSGQVCFRYTDREPEHTVGLVTPFHPDGLLTVQDVVIDAVNTRHTLFPEEEPGWLHSPIFFEGNSRFDHAEIYADGNGGLNAAGSLTITNGCYMEMTGLSLASLDICGGDNTEEDGVYPSVGVIEDSELHLRAYHAPAYWANTIFDLHPAVDMYLRTGADVRIHMSDTDQEFYPVVCHGDYSGVGAGSVMHMEDGCFTIQSEKTDVPAIRIDGGAAWTQTGGTVTLETQVCDTTSVRIESGGEWYQSGGQFSIVNTNPDVSVEPGFHAAGMDGIRNSRMVLSGGTVDISGDLIQAILNQGDLVLSGADLTLDAYEAGVNLFNGGDLMISGGSLAFRAQTRENSKGIQTEGGSSTTILGGNMEFDSETGFYSWSGLYRFLGGQATIHGNYPVYAYSPSHFLFGDGICAALEDGTGLTQDEGGSICSDGRTAIIRAQETVAPENKLHLKLFYPKALVVGTPAQAELIAALTEPSAPVEVELPQGTALAPNSLYINGVKSAYALTDTGFRAEMPNGSYATFAIIPGSGGEATMTARVGEDAFPLTYHCAEFSLALPSSVCTNTLTASGLAMAGGSLTFWQGDSQIGEARVTELGSWRTTLKLPQEEGEYFIYAMLFDSEGNFVTVSDPTRVCYQKDNTVVESLTIRNWIHGPTDLSEHIENVVTINYLEDTVSCGYYTYWPDLPEFTFQVKFQGDPADVESVWAVAATRAGDSQDVELFYDETTGLWEGRARFCTGDTITPDSFAVRWLRADSDAAGEAPETDVPPVEAVDEDYCTGAFTTAPAGTFLLELTEGSELPTVVNGWGEEVPCTRTDRGCALSLEAGEIYVLTLETPGFVQWPEITELTILAEGGDDRRVAVYQDWVLTASAEDFSDWTDTTFVSEGRYQVGDVIVIDEQDAVLVTAVDGITYTWQTPDLDEIYAQLDVSGFGPTEGVTVTLGETEEEMIARFRESDVYDAYLQALELSRSDTLEGDLDENTSFEVTLNSTVSKDRISINPIITITTNMKTKLPLTKEELDTVVELVLSYEIIEDLDYRIRSLNDDRDVQSYLLMTEETVNANVDLTVTIGEDKSSASNDFSLTDYFAEDMEMDFRRNFLEELKDTGSKKSFELLKNARVDIPVYAGITVYARPSLELDWNLFGELTAHGEIHEKTCKGVSMIHLGDNYFSSWEDWSIQKFTDPSKAESSFEANTKLHLSAYVYPALRVAVGVSALKSLNVEVYAKAGPKLSFDGHGRIGISSHQSLDAELELQVDLTLESEAGVAGFVSIGKTPLKLGKLQFALWNKSLPINTWGLGIMPTKFQQVEELVYVADRDDLKKSIDLKLECQNFWTADGIREEARVLDLDRYRFELYSGSGATVTPEGIVKIHDIDRTFEFEVKVIYNGYGEDYELWKIVRLKYTPGHIKLTKDTPEGPKTCVCLVVDVTPECFHAEHVTVPGVKVIPAVPGHTYVVTEIEPPPGYDLDPSRYVLKIPPSGGASAGFFNRKPDDPEPDDVDPTPIDPIGDPSGYVFEGIESNRLSGVTAELYQADDSRGSNARLWNAEKYDQANPLTTDALGQYQWMVPNGWWQVRWSMEGYESAQSDWMEVPPIRTEVNQNLVSPLPAELTMYYNQEQSALLAQFSRPVQLGSVRDITLTVDGKPVNGDLEPVDPGWSVTADPLDSVPCATTFHVRIHDLNDLREHSVSLTLLGVVTYCGTVMEELTATADIASLPRHTVTVIGGTGSGVYEVGQEVRIGAEENGCWIFDHWDGGNVWLHDPWSPETGFIMPDRDVTIRIVYRPEQEHTFSDWVLTQPPTVLEEGLETRTCTVCGFREHRPVDRLSNPFVDVPEGSFYHTPVLWAVARGITNGVDASHFGPDNQCQRAQVVTFLWRAMGSPEPQSSDDPFVDVAPTDFYYKAVLWAVEQGVTNGLDATHFGPYAFCNRAQVVTFLHRSLGGPAPSATDNPFTDVPQGLWYTVPVLWAVEQGVTNGMSPTTFGPDAICNRAQIVTFLYRAVNG